MSHFNPVVGNTPPSTKHASFNQTRLLQPNPVNQIKKKVMDFEIVWVLLLDFEAVF